MKQLIQLLNTVIGNNGQKLRKENEWSYYCPFCHHYKRKLQVNVKSGKWHCWVCNEKGSSFKHLLYKLKATPDKYSELADIVGDFSYSKTSITTSETNILKLPQEFKFLLDSRYKNNFDFKNAILYLKKRGITEFDIIKYNIGYCETGLYADRIIIPSYDSDMRLNFFTGRSIYNEKMKYRNSPTTKDIIGFDLFINWEEPIILCEGPFDAIAIKRNAIPLYGKTVLSKLKQKIYEKKVKTIFIALDIDANKDALEMANDFINNGITIHFVKLPGKDPSDVGFKNVTKLINNTGQLTFVDLIKLKLNDSSKKHMEIF